MIIMGVAGIAAVVLYNYYKEGAYLGSKRGDPCGITEYMPAFKGDKPYYSKINMMGADYPPKPEEATFAYQWAKFKAKFNKKEKNEEQDDDDAPEDDEK